VLLLQELDREIRQKTKDKGNLSLDDVTRGLMRLDKVSTQDFIDITENVIGGPSNTLDTRLLR
jgi:predicted metalloprotease with PDZ domain